MSICINQTSERMLCNFTLALGSCTHEYLAQVCLPLSYAAQIPTTPNPDLANVRVSLSKLDQDVRQCSVRFFVSVYLSRCVRETRVVCVWLCG